MHLTALVLVLSAWAALTLASTSNIQSDAELVVWPPDNGATAAYTTTLDVSGAATEGWPTDLCNFALSRWTFNLCPILQRRFLSFLVLEYTPPTATKIRYLIGLNGEPEYPKGSPEEERCTKGTTICIISDCLARQSVELR